MFAHKLGALVILVSCANKGKPELRVLRAFLNFTPTDEDTPETKAVIDSLEHSGSVLAPRPQPLDCAVPALTAAGWVCGTVRRTENNLLYASFRGVPYAKQPLGELRFKELQPLEPWSGIYDATSEGPACPQYDLLYGPMMQSQGMSEACIHANIHVPLEFFPYYQGRPTRHVMPSHHAAFQESAGLENNSGLPIVVFIHGGGFSYGSGDSDIHGPEYLVAKKVIVITFNYRLNVMGFLSLNSSSIPGNNGLRDMVTLLRWVKHNAQAFGGNPDDVTLAGQSAGATSAHLLTLAPAAKGLFNRVWLMSGVGPAGFYSPSPAYAQFIANLFLTQLGINSTDPEEIHRQLIHTPIEKIVETNKALLDITGLTTFVPVIESALPGVTPIMDEDPEVLAAKGRGKDIPLVIGFTTTECETFRPRFEEIDIISQIKKNPLLVVAPRLIYSSPPTELPRITTLIHKQYFNGTVNMDDFVNLCSDQYFIYPALRLAALRSQMGGAPIYLYRFAYNNEYNVLREALGLHYEGAGHIEDMTYMFRVNSILNPQSKYKYAIEDDVVINRMTQFFINFMKTSNPVTTYGSLCTWPPVNEASSLVYQDVEMRRRCHYSGLTQKEQKAKTFFDSLNDNLKNTSTRTE